MITNSKIFTDTVFGVSSGLSGADQAEKNTSTIEESYTEFPLIKMNAYKTTVPSNQRKAKDK
jgi:hypothetical protein